MSDRLQIAAKHWDREATKKRKWRNKWFLNRQAVEHCNRRICGKPLRREGEGVTELLRQRLGSSTLDKAVSVGCGTGGKELALLKTGLIEKFDLWELSEQRVRLAKENAAKQDLAARVTVRHGNAFEEVTEPRYDLVHWNMSLHHMPSVREALVWSRQVLRPGGWLYINELAGPNHYQWTDEMISVANRVRQHVPERWLKDYTGRQELLSREVKRPSVASMMKRDPTECQDSEEIPAAIQDVFPDAPMIPIGGVIYYLGLDGLYENLDESDGEALAAYLLSDEFLAERGLWLFLAAIAQKPA